MGQVFWKYAPFRQKALKSEEKFGQKIFKLLAFPLFPLSEFFLSLILYGIKVAIVSIPTIAIK